MNQVNQDMPCGRHKEAVVELLRPRCSPDEPLLPGLQTAVGAVDVEQHFQGVTAHMSHSRRCIPRAVKLDLWEDRRSSRAVRSRVGDKAAQRAKGRGVNGRVDASYSTAAPAFHKYLDGVTGTICRERTVFRPAAVSASRIAATAAASLQHRWWSALPLCGRTKFSASSTLTHTNSNQHPPLT